MMVCSFPRTLTLLLAGVLLLGLAGCPGRARLEKPQDTKVVVGGAAADFVEPTTGSGDVSIHARQNGQTLLISAINARSEEVAFFYTDFALIMGPNPKTDLVKIDPRVADLRLFTPLLLKKGERGVLRITLREVQDLKGKRLVYNNPRQNVRFFVLVE